MSTHKTVPGLFWILLALVVALESTPARGESLEELVEAYRNRPTAEAKTALIGYSESRPGEDGALALLVIALEEAKDQEGEEATARLREAKRRLPAIADYPAYQLARALYELEDHNGAIAELEEVLNHNPSSPLQADAVLLAAEIYLVSEYGREGVDLLNRYHDILPQPRGLMLLARCQEGVGDPAAAARSYQKVYYEYPVSPEAAPARSALARLRRQLGSAYPEAQPELRFIRVDRLIRGRQHLTARSELQDMTVRLEGADRDLARVWLGKARHIREHDSVAYRWLRSLKVSDPEAEAQRLYYLMAAARRLGRRAEIDGILETLERDHPTSKWRLEALVSAGNMYLLVNDHDRYLPIYSACADGFPTHERAAYCHWKVVWRHYIRRLPGAGAMLREHLSRFPASEKASAALYFLGRLAENAGELNAARSWFREIHHQYPNYHYSFLARARLKAVGEGEGSADIEKFLSTIEFPRRRHAKNFDATPLTASRLQRARLLFSAGLREWGERELRFAARNGAQGPILAIELSEYAARSGDYGQSIRFIKALAPGYLSMPLDAAPERFWKLTFPLAYRELLEKYAARRNLDPYFLAALIRQESEFNPRAVSRARAYGLTQVLPATGRILARELGIRAFRTSTLYDPNANLNMGTHYLRRLIDGLEGYTEAALAAYNAGRSRALRWLTWAEFREPAEFVETIPFTETRNYVQTVLRNAEIYRQLYQ